MIAWLLVVLVSATSVEPSQASRAIADESRLAAARYIITHEIRWLAQAGLPRSSERLGFCLGTTMKSVASGSAPTTSEGFDASFRDIVAPSSAFLSKLRDDAFDVFGAPGCQQNALGVPTDAASGRATRGAISIGPVYEVDATHVDVLVRIVRNLSSAEGSVLHLERRRDGWQVVGGYLVWGS